MRRALSIVGRVLAAGALAAAAMGVGVGAGADAPDATGWSWLANQGVGPPPPPPQVPAGGLLVENGPSGATGASALRYDLPADTTRPMLTIKVADNGGVNASSAAVLACPTDSAWVGGDNQGWAGKPADECGQASAAGSSADGTTWKFDLTSLVRDGRLNFVLLPDKTSTTPFHLAFNPPGDGAFTTSPVVSSSQTDSSFSGAVDTSPSSAADSVNPILNDASAAPPASVPGVPSVPQPLDGPASLTPSPTPTAPRTFQNAPVTKPASSSGSDRGRYLGVLVTLLVGLGVAYTGTRPDAALAGVGRSSAPAADGVVAMEGADAVASV